MRFDFVVVGCGVMGAATAHALSGRGASVAVVEQFEVGHSRGSSHGRSRIFRLSYPDARYVRMAQESLALWRELEAMADEPLLTTTGGFDTGKTLDQHVAALGECGASFELLDGGDVAARWPALRLPAGAPALWQPDAGIVAADRAVAALARLASSNGALLAEREQVDRIEQSGDGARVVTDRRSIDCEAVVVTAGAWARGLLAGAGISLYTRPTRETVAYWDVGDVVPPTLVEWGTPSIYGLPSPGQGIKVGEHAAGPTTDPDVEGRVDPDAVRRLERWVAERYPGAAPKAHHSETCIYTNTPDEHFVLERHGRIVVGSPCSGHGFKFAPLIGRRLAALAEEC